MTDANRDGNHVPVVLGQSSTDATVTLPLKIDPVTGRVLMSNASGSGDVVGPASSTDNAAVRFDSTTGKLIQNSVVIIADTTGNISGMQKITVGVAAGATGSIEIKGTTSGTVTLKTADAAGTYTLTLPLDDGASGEVLSTNGSGVLSWVSAGGVPTTITVADEATDISCFPLFVTAATGDLGPKTNAGLAFNSNTGVLTATGFSGPLTGNVTGNASGTAATVTTAAQPAITSLGTLTTLTVDDITINGNTISSAGASTLAITPTAGQAITFDGTVTLDAGVIAGATSITSTTFIGALTGTASGNLVSGGALGTPSSGTVTNLTGTASININGTVGATTPTTATFTTATINTNLVPDANDGAGLGISGTAFSDLFLASGALIDFAAGNAVITHSSGILTVSTGDLRVTTAGTNSASVVTVGGTQTLTSKTLTSPTLTTPSAFTTGGTITLAENTSIALDPAGSADGKYTGITIAGTAGATLAFGDLVYLAAADSRWELADADAATTADRMLGMCVLAAAADADPTVLLLMGQIRADAAFPALTIGSAVYVGETAGDIQVAIPTGADNVIRRVGYALTADEIYFNPSMDAQTSVA